MPWQALYTAQIAKSAWGATQRCKHTTLLPALLRAWRRVVAAGSAAAGCLCLPEGVGFTRQLLVLPDTYELASCGSPRPGAGCGPGSSGSMRTDGHWSGTGAAGRLRPKSPRALWGRGGTCWHCLPPSACLLSPWAGAVVVQVQGGPAAAARGAQLLAARGAVSGSEGALAGHSPSCPSCGGAMVGQVRPLLCCCCPSGQPAGDGSWQPVLGTAAVRGGKCACLLKRLVLLVSPACALSVCCLLVAGCTACGACAAPARCPPLPTALPTCRPYRLPPFPFARW